MTEAQSLWAQYPDYEVVLDPAGERIRVLFAGELVADSVRALVVRETKHAPVLYFPRDDVEFSRLVRCDHTTVCPFKGTASYWSLRVGDQLEENSVWSYESPFEEVAGLAGCVAFYADRVDWLKGDGD